MRIVVGIIAAFLLIGLSPITAQETILDYPAAPASLLLENIPYIRSPRLGITHISLAEEVTGEERYRNALLLGAGWNRWPLYWDRVEQSPGDFAWADYDRLAADDLRHGLSIDAILLGRPAFFQDGSRIAGLHTPIFADGTDTPAPGKAINPDNPWANFVWAAVNRYMPGGVLAQQENWAFGQGITVWEIWNEPDFSAFWEASILDYARLLKTAYLVAKLADPYATVMFGGLMFAGEDNWLARVLAIYQNDPFHEQYHWYMDSVAVHNYSYPWRSGWLTLWARQTLRAYGLQRPIWLNESGVPAWDDYPGPVWAYDQPDERVLRATEQQQADFFIQSTAYAWSEGADVVFFHQLYDDCGDQPGGTDFQFHTGEICTKGVTCAGDAFGLFRNPRGAVCYSHNPQPDTPRPAAAAYQLLARVLGRGNLSNPQVETVDDTAQVISFDIADRAERVSIIWNRTFDWATVELPAFGASAQLYSIVSEQTLRAESGVFRLALPPAMPDNFPKLEPGDVTAIGGPTFILVYTLPDSGE
ncbi:MAG: hypothetical protein K8I60_02380 [Anaerolineae bacterium]|nr:hypothetical protein [Anaerolineae bacterium]